MTKKRKDHDESLNDVKIPHGFSGNPSKPDDQNQGHNVKKQALGPNTKR